MRKERFEISVGDIVYEASKSYGKIFGWEIAEIKLEKYIAGWKTLVKLEPAYNVSYSTKKFLSDVLHMYETPEDARRALNGEDVDTIDKISDVV